VFGQYQHLDEEVEHISAENLKVFEEKAILGLIAALEKHAKANGNPFMVVPYMRRFVPYPLLLELVTNRPRAATPRRSTRTCGRRCPGS
jgi:hypothetical protein